MRGPLDGVWRRLNAELFRLLGPERYGCWIRNARPVEFDEDVFAFHCGSTYAKDKLETLLKDQVTDAAQRVTNRKVRVRFLVEQASFSGPGAAPLRDEPAAGRASFATFVAGPGNRLALAAARAFARGGPGAPRVLLVHARSGLGKTHLLGAIAEELARQTAPGVLRFSGEQFRRHFAWADLRGYRRAFVKKCAGAQVLLFDDLHLLCGVPEAQSALADILDAFADRGARIALTSEKPPRALDGLAPALRRRLRADVEVPIDRPDFATGLGFLRAHAPPSVPAPVLEYLAAHVQTSLKDQLHCLGALLDHPPPTLASARAVVGEFLNAWSRGLTYADIVRAAAESFGVKVTEIYAPDRSRAASDARHACFYLARKLLKQPFAQIGSHFGGRDHATVLQACRKLERRRGKLRDRVRRLEETLDPGP
jgi:chromosomal replication initiator protein